MAEPYIPIVADLHCHPTIPALNTNYDMWHYDPPQDWQRKEMINTSKIFGDFTQSDYSSLGKAKGRLVFHGFYPIEQGILMPDFEHEPNEGFVTSVLKFIARAVGEGIGRHRLSRFLSKVIYQMKKDRYDEITSMQHDYFNDLKKEYQLFFTQQNLHQERAQLTVIKNYTQLKALLQINDNYEITFDSAETFIKAAIVFSVEGAHSLGCGLLNTVTDRNDITKELAILNDLTHPATKVLLDKIKQNIATIKAWGPPGDAGAHAPFFITFCHHFWNQLCGQAMSFAKIMNKIANQRLGLGQGFTALGREVMKELLSKENGKRILIDIKHMSPAGRKEYYRYLQLLREQGDFIPIIASHMGVTGKYDTLPNSILHHEMDDKYENYKYHETDMTARSFNFWDINLSGEDILEIHKSGGLIGLNFDQRILSSCEIIDNLDAHSRSFAQTITITNDDGEEIEITPELHNILAYRAVWAQPLLENYLFIVRTVLERAESNKEYAWNMVCIGSDFDGFINSIDAFCHCEDFQILSYVLTEHLKLRAQYDPVLQNKDPHEIVQDFMYKNALRFLDKHFN